MGIFDKFPKKKFEKTKDEKDARQLKKYGNDGYLLPEYWQCIVCRARKADKRAAYAVHINVFLRVIEDNQYFQELDQTNRSAAKEYAYFLADPVGGAKEPPEVVNHFEDTSGLARDRTGYGFDAVYLCDAHVGELQRAIKTLDEPLGKEKMKKQQEPALEKPPASNEPKTMDDQQLKTDIAGELRRKTEEHMAILRFLCTCGKFDRDKVTTYFSMAEKIGVQWEEQDKHRMLNAALIFPKRQSDGTVLNGFEQVREMLMESHAEALSKGVTVFKQLLPTLPLNEATVKANADFLVQVGSESKELIRTLLSNRS